MCKTFVKIFLQMENIWIIIISQNLTLKIYFKLTCFLCYLTYLGIWTYILPAHLTAYFSFSTSFHSSPLSPSLPLSLHLSLPVPLMVVNTIVILYELILGWSPRQIASLIVLISERHCLSFIVHTSYLCISAPSQRTYKGHHMQSWKEVQNNRPKLKRGTQ